MDGSSARRLATLTWWVVVPVKGGAGAKSRLAVPGGVDRAELARAMALDVVVAAADAVGAGRVVVVTSSPQLTEHVCRAGARPVPDPHDGLDAAALAGAAQALDGGADAVAVLVGDVAAVRGADVSAALLAAQRHPRAFVPDLAGTGTALLTAVLPARLRPAFGPGSARRHAAAGHTRLDLALPRLRTDVDDAGALAQAQAWGLGPSAEALLAAYR